MCMECMLSGTFSRNQFLTDNILTAEKIPSPDPAISMRDGLEASQSEASKLQSRSLTVKN